MVEWCQAQLKAISRDQYAMARPHSVGRSAGDLLRPQHYITPNWYPEKGETGKVVPTWNYVVVHAYGHLKVIEDGMVDDPSCGLTKIHEAESPVPGRLGTPAHRTLAKGHRRLR
jgi:predicted FMN-binding regulatory protein PaiB